ncbi:MAG: aminoglycoside phosphotransferase family protein [Chloroflexota bacterium]|nr:aminoglycoside phosphotransferase family protein [Chloroflexota bacterium]
MTHPVQGGGAHGGLGPGGLADTASGRVREVVREALGEPGAVVGEWDAVSLKGGLGALDVGRSLFVLQGVARVGGAERPWSVVLKVLARTAGEDDPARIGYWKRELLLCRSGLLDELPAGLRAPRCYGCDEPADGVVWLWLEHVREEGERAWPPARWSLAARHLGRFNGAYLAGRPLPRAPWLGGRRLRTWLERHHPQIAQIAAAPGKPEVRRWWPQPVVDAVIRLWEERDAFCAALERLPQTFGHGDAIRRNLLIRRGADGAEETVGIDWEFAGHYAAGEEVGQTLSVASAFYDVEPADLPALDEALFAGYLAGLRDAGWGGDPRQVRFALAAHAALRNAFNAVGASVPEDARRAAAQQTYGRTWEELAERRAAVRPFLLERADEARHLMGTL